MPRRNLSLVLTLSLIVAVTCGIQRSAQSNVTPQAKPFSITLPKSVVKIDMVPVPAGSVEIQGKTVPVAAFSIATTELTWEAFDLFLSSGPPSEPYDQTEFTADAIARPSKTYNLPDRGWGHRGYPVISVTSTSAEMFCRWLSKVTGKKFRLPTEAEWELACRGGVSGPWKMDAATIAKQSWNAGNSKATTHPVGKKEANAFGIFDMLGNAGEWATDLNGEPVLCGPTFRDPAASVSPSVRKKWTAKWQESDPQMPKSRWWLSDGPFAGLRVVCEN